MKPERIPCYRYRVTPDSPTEGLRLLHDSARLITHHGRSGWNFSSIRGRAQVPGHTVGEDRGTLAVWVLPLQDMFPAWHSKGHAKSNPHFDRFVILSDRESVQDVEAANFMFMYHTGWHPVLMAKFKQGTIGEVMFYGPQGAMATAGHFEMKARRWYHFAVTWDRPAGIYRIYANGVLVGHSDCTAAELPHEAPAPALYFGNPALAIGDLAFYQEILDQETLRGLHAEGATREDLQVQKSLERIYEGKNLEPFPGEPGEQEGWRAAQDLSLTRPEDYAAFFHQGTGPSLAFTPEGLRISTPGFEEYLKRRNREPADLDMTRLYLFTRRIFEGDLYLSFRFRLNRPGGLALLMAQAAGMQGEDFLEDYPLRSTGSMSMVCWEDVRNYHWEFYREMVDTRNDLASHACLKNPWHRPMGFQIEPRKWETGRWYRLEYLQEGGRLRGAIDGVTVIDANDTGFDNNGPVLQHGRLAFRAMMRTDMTLRDWSVRTKPLLEGIKPVFRGVEANGISVGR